MQDKKWPWVLLLLAGAWLVLGMPGTDGIPSVFPSSAPFVVEDGQLHALVVRKKQSKYSNDQMAVIDGKVLRSLPAGKWAVREPGQDVSADYGWIKGESGAMKAASSIQPPSLTYSNGKSGDTIPLPANEAELQAIFTKYGD